MPTNKNAVIRYKVLDEMLSDRCHFYDINDLTEGCNDKLLEFQMSVSRRCIEKDIKALEDNPFLQILNEVVIMESIISSMQTALFLCSRRNYLKRKRILFMNF